MLSVHEAAKRADRDPETIRRWIRAGKLIAWKVGGQHVIDEDDLSDAVQGIFATPTEPDDADAPMSSAQIVSAIHRGRAERMHELREATATYIDDGPRRRLGALPALDAVLPLIVGRIVRASDPVRIILFGSRARGRQRDDSDYDLLIVLDAIEDRRSARIAIRRSFEDVPVSADVLVATADEVDGRIPGRPTGAVFWAVQEGRAIYDRADGR